MIGGETANSGCPTHKYDIQVEMEELTELYCVILIGRRKLVVDNFSDHFPASGILFGLD
jgi:hypothetical protein